MGENENSEGYIQRKLQVFESSLETAEDPQELRNIGVKLVQMVRDQMKAIEELKAKDLSLKGSGDGGIVSIGVGRDAFLASVNEEDPNTPVTPVPQIKT
jgi:hypothetical protein